MTLRRLQVTDLRCLQSAALELDPKFTLISGPNASGKTSLLEAIYILGRGRSFRTRQLEHLIRRGANQFVVFGEVEGEDRRVPIGVEGSTGGVRGQMAGARVASLAELAVVLPVQIIDPEVHRLIEEGPSRRRQFLDWGAFHIDPTFVPHWQRFRSVLKQRNAALKSSQPRAAVAAWDADLLRYGGVISAARAHYVELLTPAATFIGRNLLGMDLTLAYRSGWPRDLSFAEALRRTEGQEADFGATVVGPQRAELAIRLDGAAVKDRISRGQQKLLAAALLIAQVKLFPEGSSMRPTLLLDDPAAELDDERLASLIREVSAQAVQLVVTTLHGEFPAFGVPGRRFGIGAGCVRAL